MLLFDNPRVIKNSASEYRKLQGDSVHFEDYLPIAKNLLKNAVSVFTTFLLNLLVRNTWELCWEEEKTHSLQNVSRQCNFLFDTHLHFGPG
jgi:hypothetical protein